MTKKYTFGFVLEQTLGHRTHSQNLLQNVPSDPAVQARWVLVEEATRGLAAHIPVYKSNWTVRAGLRARRQIATLQRTDRVDALFFHTQVPAILAANWIKKIPSVLSLDATPLQYDSLGEQYQHQRGPAWLERMKWRLNHQAYAHARHIITWSSWTKQGLVDEYGVSPEKITVIPPGVNPDAWQNPNASRDPEEPIKILFVGGNLERKGGDVLLKAFRILRQQLEGEANLPLRKKSGEIELHIVTKDELANEAGVMVYRDMQPNSDALKSLYHHCNVFCLPTLGDCLPMVLSEAGAAGLPLISTDVGGITEIVVEGQTGSLTRVDNVDQLVSILRNMVENPLLRIQMGQNAMSLVRTRFDAQKNTAQLLEILKQSADNAKAISLGSYSKQAESAQMKAFQ